MYEDITKNKKNLSDKQKRLLEEFNIYVSKFEGMLGETPVITVRKTPEEEARKEANKIRNNFKIVYKGDGVIGTQSSWNDKKFSEDLNFDEYKQFLDWAASEITHFEASGTKKGIEAAISFIKQIGLFENIENLGYTEEQLIDTIYRQIGWAGVLIENSRDTWSYADREREHFGYYEANLNTFLESIKDTKGKPYYQGYAEEE
tara:strand:+ start:106 stop:714 length:609 start_codon:yes stop_codon:yes gene_type:complete